MALPSSGQISFNDVRTEMGQTSTSNYAFSAWGRGYGIYDSGPYFAPINVHSSNSGKYSTTTPLSLNTWHGYNHSLNYASDGTQRDLFFSFSPSIICYPTSMIVFDLGTTSETKNIHISGSVTDFDYVLEIALFHGKPYNSSASSNPGSLIWVSGNPAPSGIDTTVSYSYTYGTGYGQYLYAVLYGNCP
jgi:hypothetical protein